MKKYIKSANSATTAVYGSNLFTPKEVADFLKHIDELKNSNISLNKDSDGVSEFIIGNTAYRITDMEKSPIN